jgi:ABC-type nitrate/sulfonate/bicarbonate transport system substrate-binding protein
MQQTTHSIRFKSPAICRRSRRHYFFTRLTAHLIVLVIPALAPGAAAPLRVKIGTASISSSTLSLWIAQEQGIFNKHGVEAQAILVRGGPMLVSSLVAGDIDFAFTTGVSILGAATQGVAVKMLSSISNRVSWKLVAAPQIKRAHDLRGKRFGVQSIVGSTWMNSILALEQLGLEPKRDNISFLVIGDPVTMAHALETGRIDAAVLDPILSRGLISKRFSLLLDLLHAKVFFPGLGLGVTRPYLDQHARTVEKLVTALTESLAFIHRPENKTLVLKSMMKNLRMNDPAAAEEGYDDQLLTLNRKPYPSLEGLRNAQRVMTLQNPKIAALKIEELIDSRFVRKLDESGFIDRLYKTYPSW